MHLQTTRRCVCACALGDLLIGNLTLDQGHCNWLISVSRVACELEDVQNVTVVAQVCICCKIFTVMQELNVKLTKLGRQLEANQKALEDIKAVLQQPKLADTPDPQRVSSESSAGRSNGDRQAAS